MKKFKLLALTALFCTMGTNTFAAAKYAIKDGVWYYYDDAAADGTQADPYQATVFGLKVQGDDVWEAVTIPASFDWTSPADQKMYFKVVGFNAAWAQQVPTDVDDDGETNEFDVSLIVTLNTLTVNIDNFAAAGFTNMVAGLKRLSSLTLIDSKVTAGKWAPTEYTVANLALSDQVKKTLTTLNLAKTGIKEIAAASFKVNNPANSKFWAKLTSITLPDGLVTIGANAFEGFKGTAITLPATVKTIGTAAFKGATGITTVAIPAATTEIGISAFEGTGLTSVNFNSATKLATIGNDAFKGCTGLTTIDLSKAVITDGLNAPFTGCTDITAITLNNKVTTLAANLFKDTKIEEITALGVTTVGKVMGATKAKPNTTLKTVTLGPVVNMAPEAFAYCSALEEVTIDFDGDAAAEKMANAETAAAAAEAALAAAQTAKDDADADVETAQTALETAQADYATVAAASQDVDDAWGELNEALNGAGSTLTVAYDTPLADVEAIADAVAAVPAAYEAYAVYAAAETAFAEATAALTAAEAADAVYDPAWIGVAADEEAHAAVIAAFNAKTEANAALAALDATVVDTYIDALQAAGMAGAYDAAVTALTEAEAADAAYDPAWIGVAVDEEAHAAVIAAYNAKEEAKATLLATELDEDDIAAVATAYTAYTTALTAADAETAAEAGGAKVAALAVLGDAVEDLSDAQAAVLDAEAAVIAAQADYDAAQLGYENGLVIPEKAFYYCTALTTFNYAPTDGDYKYVSDNAFLGCSSSPLVHFVTSTIYQTKFPDAPFQTTYGDVAATTITTKADAGTSGKFFAKFTATSKVTINPDDAKVYSVYVDDGIAYFQALAKKSNQYVLFAGDDVIIKTDEEKEVEITPYNGTVAQSSVLIDNIWCLGADTPLADFQSANMVAGEYVYRLTNNAASGGFGFTYFTGATMKKGQFFIISNIAPAAGGRIATVWLDEDGNVEQDETTGISTIAAEKVLEGVIYNMAGQQVDSNYKGVVIKNGKKVILK